MHKVFLWVGWLTLVLCDPILIVFAPRSWLCPPSPVTGVLYNPFDGTMLVVRNAGEDAEVWERDGEQPVSHYSFADRVSVVTSVAFAPDGQTILTGSYDHAAIFLDTRSGVPVRPVGPTLLGGIWYGLGLGMCLVGLLVDIGFLHSLLGRPLPQSTFPRKT